MDGGINRVGPGFGASQTHRVAPKDEREREEQADFAELVEQASPGAESEEDEHPEAGRGIALDAGYPTDDETGTSLDLKA